MNIKRFMTQICAVILLLSAGAANAELVKFDFTFYDSNGSVVGDGFYQFDDIAPSTSASFSSLTNFTWEFDIFAYGILVGSAEGDLPSSDSLFEEGISLTGAVGSRELTFFDNVATFIWHQDLSVGRSGVEFRDDDLDWVSYTDIGEGTFTSIESSVRVPEPHLLSIILFGFLAVCCRRFK